MVAMYANKPRDYCISTDKMLLDMAWVIAQLRASHWGGWYTPEMICAAVDRSLCFGLYKPMPGGTMLDQIGFARVVGDGTTFSSIMDVIIDPLHRHQGFGRKLMDEIIASNDVKNTICILATTDASGFYEKFGFRAADGVMKRDPG